MELRWLARKPQFNCCHLSLSISLLVIWYLVSNCGCTLPTSTRSFSTSIYSLFICWYLALMLLSKSGQAFKISRQNCLVYFLSINLLTTLAMPSRFNVCFRIARSRSRVSSLLLSLRSWELMIDRYFCLWLLWAFCLSLMFLIKVSRHTSS